jgi:NADH-quinone oxidoreductase subunit H
VSRVGVEASEALTLTLALLAILVLASLGTVVERKILGSCQRRTGPSTCGWYGVGIVVADGAKLAGKACSITPHATGIVIVLALFGTLSAAGLLWSGLSGGSTSLLATLAALGVAHLVVSSAGSMTQACSYGTLGSFRGVVVTAAVDLPLMLAVLSILPRETSILVSELSSGYTGSSCPLLMLVLFILVTADLGRVPFDVVEAESELVAGWNVEYPGLLYAMLATVEYGALYIWCLLMALPLVGHLNSLPAYLVCMFILIIVGIVARATLPRVRLPDLLRWAYSTSLPLVAFVSLTLSTL